MEKITADSQGAKSANIVAENITRLKELFPEAFAEDGIDFEVLKQLLGGVVNEKEEKYSFTWPGKRQARQIALTPSLGTLRPAHGESVDWDSTKNIFIEGDNLEVLKLLQKSYSGKVKMIYIDPPYNTGNDFVYHDDFRDNIKNYKKIEGINSAEGTPLTSNKDTSGRFHTEWLNMMYPRLLISRTLLKDSGVILISIDDAELINLRKICDEIFGEENFIANVIWEKGRKNDAKLISVGHEYILMYAKRKSWFQEENIKWREAKPGAQDILSEYIKLRKVCGDDNLKIEKGIKDFYDSLPKDHPAKKHSRYNKVDEFGVWRDDNMSWPGGGGPAYDVLHPKTGKPCAVPEGGWRYSTIERMNEMIAIGKVVFRNDHTEPPIRKTYLIEVGNPQGDNESIDAEELFDEDIPIQVAGTYFYRSALQATNELKDIFSDKIFNNPKDVDVIARWVKYVGVSANDIVMDFFAGSGTTAHSILNLNFFDGLTVRYILVQLPEPIDERAKGTKPAIKFLEKYQFPCRVSEITKERIRRVIKKIKTEHPDYTGDLGFRVFKLDSSNIRPWNPDASDIAASLLAYTDNLLPDRTEQDLLYEVLLKFGLDLTSPMQEKNFAGHTVYSMGQGVLFACLSKAITSTDIEPIGLGIANWRKETNPVGESTVIFRDSAFAGDVAKANMTAILQQHGIDNVRSL